MAEHRNSVVVGAGVIGLTTAVCLQDAGWRVRIVCADMPLETTSAMAAAIWYPYGVGGRRVLGWAAKSHKKYLAQAREAPGVRLCKGRELFRAPTCDPEWASIVGGVIHPPRDTLPPGYADAHEFIAPIVEMPSYLNWLTKCFTDRGGSIERRSLSSLDELLPVDGPIVNCAGLGAVSLVGDYSLMPVRGQVVRVRNPGLTSFLRDDGNPEGRTYIYPRGHDCILGGSAERGSWSVNPDPATTERILRVCRQLEPRLRGVEMIETLVGLRPWRSEVRLETEIKGPESAVIVHNYGHGGAGITLAWGCAVDAVQLVMEATS